MMSMLGLRPKGGSKITVYRGQKDWNKSMRISAASMKRSWGSPADMNQWTDVQLNGFQKTLKAVRKKAPHAESMLESMLLNAQLYAFLNPFVSCSFEQAIALSFALAGKRPTGFVLKIEGSWYNGIDFEFIRNHFRFWGDAVDYLKEFGIPKDLKSFRVVEVSRVDLNTAPVRVYP